MSTAGQTVARSAIPWDQRLPPLREDLLERYLTFIGAERPAAPSHGALARLQRAHLLAIPFETISPMLDHDIPLDEDAIARKLLSGRRGGYCFEHNLLFGRALRALGFDAEILAGRALIDARADEPRPRTHVAVRVRVDGDDWLADVGFGRSAFREPLDLGRRDPQESGGYVLRIDLERGEFVVCVRGRDGAFEPQYVLAPSPVQQVDCEQLGLWVATDPRSVTRTSLIVLRPLPEGRRAISFGRLMIDEPGRHVDRELGVDEAAEVLRTEFGLELPEPLPDVVRPTGDWSTHRRLSGARTPLPAAPATIWMPLGGWRNATRGDTWCSDGCGAPCRIVRFQGGTMSSTQPARASARRALLVAACALPAVAATPAHAATSKTIFSAPLPGTLDTDGTRYLLTQATRDGATLLVGRLGAEPEAQATVKMPPWARPHLGTSASGRTVVVYPSCVTAAGGCDLRVVDLATGRDQLVSNAATQREELEGDMDRGAVAWLVADDVPKTSQIPGYVPVDVGRIRYRAAKGKARTLAGPGGMELSLDRGRILLVRRSMTEGIGGEGGAVIVDVLRTSGRRARVVAIGSGEDFQRIEGPRFIGRQRVAWGMVTASNTTYRQRSLTSTAKPTSAKIIRGGMSVAPLTTRSALALQSTTGFDSWAQWTEDGSELVPDPPFPLVRVSGLTSK